MPKVRLTKNELKKQKDSLRRFNRYLPTLKLKKQQLQVEIGKIQRLIEDLSTIVRRLEEGLETWVDVFAEEVDFRNLLKIKRLITETGNVAGIDIPVLIEVEFEEKPYDFLVTPLWVDSGIEVCKEIMKLKAQILVASEQEKKLQEELRITVQRVNLFEKVKIPEAQENIRIINIYLGDLQTAEVVRGKIAKSKIEKKKEAQVL